MIAEDDAINAPAADEYSEVGSDGSDDYGDDFGDGADPMATPGANEYEEDFGGSSKHEETYGDDFVADKDDDVSIVDDDAASEEDEFEKGAAAAEAAAVAQRQMAEAADEAANAPDDASYGDDFASLNLSEGSEKPPARPISASPAAKPHKRRTGSIDVGPIEPPKPVKRKPRRPTTDKPPSRRALDAARSPGRAAEPASRFVARSSAETYQQVREKKFEGQQRDKRRIAALMRKVAALEGRLDEFEPKRVRTKRRRKVRRPASAVAPRAASPTSKVRPKSASAKRTAWDERFNAPARGPVRPPAVGSALRHVRQAVAGGRRREAPPPPVFKVVMRSDRPASSRPRTVDAATGRRVDARDYVALQQRRTQHRTAHVAQWATTNGGLGMAGTPTGLTRTATKWTKRAQTLSGARLMTTGSKPPRAKYLGTFSPTERAVPPTRLLIKYDSRHKFGDFKDEVKRRTYRDEPGYPTGGIRWSVKDYETKLAKCRADEDTTRYVRLIEGGLFREARPHEPPKPKFSDLPTPAPRPWAEYDALGAWDCLVSVEAAPNSGEQMTTKHDPAKYRVEADKAARAALDALSDWGVRCGSLVKLVPGAKTKEDKRNGLPGLGALEVQVAVRFFEDVPPKVGVLFSKLQLRTFPSASRIRSAVADFVKRAGVPSAADADAEGGRWAEDATAAPWTWASDHRPSPDHELVVPTFDEFVDHQRNAGNETFANAFTFEEAPAAKKPARSPTPEPTPSSAKAKTPPRTPSPEPEPDEEDAASYGDDFAGDDGAAPDAEAAADDDGAAPDTEAAAADDDGTAPNAEAAAADGDGAALDAEAAADKAEAERERAEQDERERVEREDRERAARERAEAEAAERAEQERIEQEIADARAANIAKAAAAERAALAEAPEPAPEPAREEFQPAAREVQISARSSDGGARPPSGRPGSARERPSSGRPGSARRPESASNKGGSRPGSARPETNREELDAATSDAAVEGFRAAMGAVDNLEELLAKFAEDELGGRVSATGLRRLAKKMGHPDPEPAVLAAILTAVDIDGDGAVPPQDAVVFARGLVPGGGQLGSLWRNVRGLVKATRYDITQIEEQLFLKYDTNRDGSISLRKFQATLEKVAQKARGGHSLEGVDWSLVQAIWGVPQRVDYVTFCSWLNPTKLHRLKQKASKLAARAVKASGEDESSFWQGLCLKHAPPAEDSAGVASSLTQPQLRAALQGLGFDDLDDAAARAIRVAFARTEPAFDADAFSRLLADGRGGKAKPRSKKAKENRPPRH